MPLFIASTALLFVAMLAAIVVFARESEEEEAGHGEEPAAAVAEGDAEAGREVFASAACGSCHVLEAAGASGTIGPNLDETQSEHDAIVLQVTNGGGGMPAFGDQLTEQQIQDVAAFVAESTG
jgi:mono/diheme cytochrome c family protein